jgi:putative ATPase
LLPEVENGIVTLVGATTENPYFTINNALISRSRIFRFEPLTQDHIKTLLRRAATDKERGLGMYAIHIHEDALDFLADICDGDARQAISALEIGVLSSESKNVEFTRDLASESVQRKAVLYDQDGDSHYDTISALIKSIRGSDPDAAIYWLAKMLVGGDDVRFLARRLVILASEDVGNADPRGLMLAVAAAQACELVGLPECQLNLAQTVLYLACAPKSNSATTAIYEARQDVQEGRLIPVPKHLRDPHNDSSTQKTAYQYAHDYKDGIAAQEYLGVDKDYYRPTQRGFEAELTRRLEFIKERLKSET